VLGGIWEIAFCRAGRAGPVGPARPAGELTPRDARLVRRGPALADCRAAGPAVRIDGGALPEGLCPPAWGSSCQPCCRLALRELRAVRFNLSEGSPQVAASRSLT